MTDTGWQSKEVRKKAQQTLAEKMAEGVVLYWSQVKKIDEEKERQIMKNVRYE